MAGDSITHTAWTLRFKHGKHTVLLFTDPLSPFSQIKSDLLKVLQERYPDGLPRSDSPTPAKIPDSIVDLILGIPNDLFDVTKGWTELDTDSGGGIRESPKSLGLKDVAMIAFAFVQNAEEETPEFHVEFSNVAELYPEDE